MLTGFFQDLDFIVVLQTRFGSGLGFLPLGSSGVATSQTKNWGGQNVWFQTNNTILFKKTPLKALNVYIFRKFGDRQS